MTNEEIYEKVMGHKPNKEFGAKGSFSWNDIDALMNEAVKNCSIPVVVRSVFTIHSTEDEGIVKIVGTEDEAKQQVEEFKKQHSYADFFYEKQNVS